MDTHSHTHTNVAITHSTHRLAKFHSDLTVERWCLCIECLCVKKKKEIWINRRKIWRWCSPILLISKRVPCVSLLAEECANNCMPLCKKSGWLTLTVSRSNWLFLAIFYELSQFSWLSRQSAILGQPVGWILDGWKSSVNFNS